MYFRLSALLVGPFWLENCSEKWEDLHLALWFCAFQVRVLLLLGDLGLSPLFSDSKSLVESLKRKLMVEANHKVKAQLLLTLGLLTKNLHGKDSLLLNGVLDAVKEALKDTNHTVRRTGLQMLGEGERWTINVRYQGRRFPLWVQWLCSSCYLKDPLSKLTGYNRGTLSTLGVVSFDCEILDLDDDNNNNITKNLVGGGSAASADKVHEGRRCPSAHGRLCCSALHAPQRFTVGKIPLRTSLRGTEGRERRLLSSLTRMKVVCDQNEGCCRRPL